MREVREKTQSEKAREMGGYEKAILQNKSSL